MTENLPANSSIDHSIRWYHALLLGACLAIGAGLRFHDMTRESLWLDEYWSLYLSTARAQPGQAVFDAPVGVLIDPPPAVGFAGAGPWWKIWTGMTSAIHPPLYHIVLRWWVDLFGDGDFSTRSLSAVLDLAGAVLLFELLRRTQGPWPGVIAAGLLCFSCIHIDQSQETRSYTLLVFFGLLMCLALVKIEQDGVTRSRLIALGAAAAAMALTHYFSAGALLGTGIYALLRLRGRQRSAVVVTLLISMFLVTAAWGPFFWQARRGLGEQGIYLSDPFGGGVGQVCRHIEALPARLLFDADSPSKFMVYPLAILVFLVPLAGIARTRDGSFWWLWIMATILFVAVFDLVRRSWMLEIPRYAFLASVGMYALLATPLPLKSRLRWLVGPTLLLCALCCGINRASAGPALKAKFQNIAQTITQLSLPGDVIVYTTAAQYHPQNTYLAVRHYLPDDSHPVVFLDNGLPDPATLKALGEREHFWIVGMDAARETPIYFPGFSVGIDRPQGPFLAVWRVQSPTATAIPPDSTGGSARGSNAPATIPDR